MTDIVQTLTPADVSAVRTQADFIPDSIKSVVPPTTFVFWAGFDGTNNTASDPSYSGDAQSTAIGAMRDQIRIAKDAENNVNIGVRAKGVSFALLLEKPCHVVHALS